MALPLRFFVPAVLLAWALCALAALQLAAPTPSSPEGRGPVSAMTAVQLRALAVREARRVQLLQRATALDLRTRNQAGFVLEADSEWAEVADQLRRQWNGIPGSEHRTPIGAHVGMDTVTAVGLLPRMGGLGVSFVLPSRAEADRCLVIVHVSRPRGLASRSAHRYLTLGPCAYYAAFGRPGRHVEAWLAAGASGFGALSPWHPPDVRRAEAVRPWYHRSMTGSTGGTSVASLWAPLGNASLLPARCMAGDLQTCRRLFADVQAFRRTRFEASLPGTMSGETVWWDLERYPFLLADLVREFGPERFGAFWRSPAPLEEAFVAGFGIPIDSWMRRWLTALYGGLAPGVRTRPTAVVASLGTLAVLIVIGAGLSTRRQVR